MAIEPGERLDIPERARKNQDRFTPIGRGIREAVNSIGGNVVQFPNENLEDGTGVAAIATAIVYAAEDYLPVRLGASVSVTNVSRVEGQPKTFDYTIDVNGALENQARLKAKITSGTGFTSLWSDKIEVKEMETLAERPVRDTYRYKIRIQVL